jgi:thiamine pyrophosphate-dependent acetolactate synthase large subunit-like protein
MHNNRAYENTLAHGLKLSKRRKRPTENAELGNLFENPTVDFAAMARSYGMHAIGPVTDLSSLDKALGEAIRIVEGGSPVLVDVVTALGEPAP